MNASYLSKKCLVLLGATFLGAHSPPASAAVTWNAPVTVSSDTDVSTLGTLAYAYNFGQSATGTTINTVPFTAASGAGDTNGVMTFGSVTIESWSGIASTNNLGFFVLTSGYPSPYGALSGQYQAMLGGCAFLNTPGSSEFLKLTLGGLSFGQAYQVQFWVNDPRVAINSLSETITSGGSLSGTLDANTTNADGGVGQFVIGSFTATSASQEFLFTRNDTGGPGPGQELSGFQLRSVPEPSSMAMLAGALGFMLLGKRSRVYRIVPLAES